jgi:hypothetical protein
MDAQIIETVVAIAKQDAVLFFSEFQEPIDVTQTDWDAVAWSDSQSVVSEIDENSDPSDYHQIYMETLQAETQKLGLQGVR